MRRFLFALFGAVHRYGESASVVLDFRFPSNPGHLLAEFATYRSDRTALLNGEDCRFSDRERSNSRRDWQFLHCYTFHATSFLSAAASSERGN